jgi:coproporphyrinogen III oxidase-like Fe-S oxidoreductase
MTYVPTSTTAPTHVGPLATDIHALLETVSLYLHIPFCQAKCHYCDFNSYAGMMGWRERYVDALGRRDAAERSSLAAARPAC